jgi:hypothetical protein
MKKLISEWSRLSVQTYNNTNLQSELVSVNKCVSYRTDEMVNYFCQFIPGLTSMHATIELAGMVGPLIFTPLEPDDA